MMGGGGKGKKCEKQMGRGDKERKRGDRVRKENNMQCFFVLEDVMFRS